MRPGFLSDWLDHCLTSYWFLPGLLTLLGGAFALVMLQVDAAFDTDRTLLTQWLGATSIESARSLLATLTGSIITLTGTVFSIVIVALTLASSQFGPRLLRGFMRDRHNQAALGGLIATFVYCLVALVAIGRVEEVPQATVAVSVLLAIVDAFVLIGFIHHVSVSIHASNVLAGVTRELAEQIRAYAPSDSDEDDAEASPADLPALDDGAERIRSTHSGYVRTIDEQQLLRLAVKDDAYARLSVRPGDFVVAGQPLALASARPSDTSAWVTCFRLGPQRSTVQDLRYSIDQLVEVALRALSPGINDPATAQSCIHRLGEALVTIARRRPPAAVLTDDDGTPRIVCEPRPDLRTLLAPAFAPILAAAADHAAVREEMARMLTVLADLLPDGRGAIDSFRAEHGSSLGH